MKNRVIRSALIIAYIGFALSGQLGSIQSYSSAEGSQQSAVKTLTQASR